MFSTPYRERVSSVDGSQSPSGSPKSRLGDRLDEMAVFALIVVALFYIAALGCWFIM
jgi:hypothetical protein